MLKFGYFVFISWLESKHKTFILTLAKFKVHLNERDSDIFVQHKKIYRVFIKNAPCIYICVYIYLYYFK